MNIETAPGLLVEVSGRELAGPLGTPAPRRGITRYLLGVPAVLLLALLVVPMLWTLVWALFADRPVLGNFGAVLTDPTALRAAWHSLLWVLIALVLLVVGYGIAVLSRLVNGLWRVLLYALILPFGVSAVVAGAVFRLIFDPSRERGMASALFGGSVSWLGPDLIWFVLASAFAWSWLGFIVVLFRAGMDTGGVARLGRLRLPFPGPVTAIVVLTVLVAAIRVFDLVLIATPDSVQGDVDVVGLRWWQMSSQAGDTGGAAALAVLLFLVVGALSVASMRVRRDQDPVVRTVTTAAPTGRPRWWSWLLTIGIGLMWLLPVVVLIATALHDPATAGALGWWHLGGLGFSSFVEVGTIWLGPAVAGSFLIAALATVLVLAAAVPAAYLLTWVVPRKPARVLTAVLAVLAVAPVQMYAGPLGEAFDDLGLIGARAPLALVHAAAGFPFATLVLRTAFLAAPRSSTDQQRPALDEMWRRSRYRPTLIAVVVLEFVLVWNDFIVGFLISGSGTSPLTLFLWGEARQFGISAGTVAASAVVSAVIPVVLLLATWRKVVIGLTGGVAR